MFGQAGATKTRTASSLDASYRLLGGLVPPNKYITTVTGSGFVST